MDKPLSLMIKETKMKLVDVCNESKLPTCILELIVKDLFNEIHMLAEEQLKQDQLVYKQKTEKKDEKIRESNE